MRNITALRLRILRDLAEGQTITAAAYAREKHVRQSAVSNILGALGSIVVKDREGTQVFYRAADTSKVREKLTDKEYEAAGGQTSAFTFEGLLTAWNIAPRALDLPSRVHRMAVKEDEELLFE